jgi:acetyltransferase-like isoleucine patch superfamily enzyme
MRLGVVEVGSHSYGVQNVRAWGDGDKPRLRVGAYCSIANDVQFLIDGDHHTEFVTTFPLTEFPSFEPILDDPTKKLHPRPTGPIIVGNDVWIGERCLILGGVEIGDGAVIGAGAVVASSITPYSICGGVPARLIRYRFEQDTIDRLGAIQWWDWPPEVVRRAATLLMASPNESNLSELERIGAAWRKDNHEAL